MRRVLLLLHLLLLPILAAAQDARGILQLSDSLGEPLRYGWRFADGDDPARARKDFDDTRWPEQDTRLADEKQKAFSGIGWFRLHFMADSALASRPIGMSMTHKGASEVYLDGQLIFSRGKINGKEATSYEVSQALPVPVKLTDSGHHVLAVRYANWAGLGSELIYRREPPGFIMTFTDGEKGVIEIYEDEIMNVGSSMLLAGVFATLFFLHLVFFFYNPSDKSNLWFSAFNLSIALLFFLPFLLDVVSDPEVSLFIRTYTSLLPVAAGFSMSGFLNALFSRSAMRFRVIAFLCVIVCAVYLFAPDYMQAAFVILFAVIGIEAVFLIGRAIYRKTPGARIIGGGLAMLILMVLIFVTLVVANVSLRVRGGSALSFAFMIMICSSILSIPISISVYLAHNFWMLGKKLKLQLVQVEELSRKNMEQEAEKQRLLENRQEELEREVALRTREVMQQKSEIEEQHVALMAEKKKSDDLLRNILPEEVADELKEHGSSVARLYKDVTVLFTDFANFTQMSEELSPEALVAEIDDCFKAFDGIIDQYGLEKIKTVGDAYIAVAGLPTRHPEHAHAVVDAALAIRDFMDERRRHHPKAFGIRLGVHSGPVVAGIVGLKKFAYDIWGDTVNTAARMEQHGEVGRINVSQASFELLQNDFSFTYRGVVEAKHKGKLGMYFAERINVNAGV